MKVPLLDLQAQYAALRDEVLGAIERVCDAQRFILGPEVEGFEEEVAALCGVSHAVGLSSGSDALLVALMALGVGPGDEVVTPAYSFFGTAGAVARLGARPVFVDIDPSTFNMDAGAALDAVTPRTKAVIPVHLFGRTAPLEPLLDAADRGGFSLVEDAAQALGATFPDGETHAGAAGRVGCFSFYPSKNLGGAGDGGMAVTDDSELADRLRVLRSHGERSRYQHEVVGGNFRLDEIQAAVLRVKLPHLHDWCEARRAAAARYRALFEEAETGGRITIPAHVAGHVYHQFVIRVVERDALQSHLAEVGVSTAVYYPRPLPFQACFRDLGYANGDFPHAEAASRESLALPIFPEIAPEQQRYVVDRIMESVE